MKKWIKKTIMIAGGGGVGFLGGFFGGGGGMLGVPLLSGPLKTPAKKAHATTMLIILPMSIFSAATYYFKGIFDLKNTLIVGAGVVAGGILGALLLKKLNSFAITLIFALLMIAAGIKMIIG